MTNNTLILSLPAFVIKQLGLKKRLNLKRLKVFVALAAMILLVCCVFQSMSRVGEKYRLKALQEKVSQLGQENKTLEIDSAKAVSLMDKEAKIQSLGFEKTGKINYIQISENELVRK